MAEIRAFVGHVFAEGDAEVIRKFLKYFEQLSELESNFSWEHAEAAEPKVLADKVISLLSEKNVFIGICTRCERVIQPASLKETFLFSRFLRAHEREFDWKTSDWVIQEIGLAIGKGLNIILLLEEGVRKPGGLQGDIEYIEFGRAEPEKAFGKILEMLSTLSLKTTELVPKSSDLRIVTEEENEKHETPTDDHWRTPQIEWKRSDYEYALVQMILNRDAPGIEEIYQAYLRTGDAIEVGNQDSWEAYRGSMQLGFGEGGNLERLKTLAAKYPTSSIILKYLARGYTVYSDYKKAAFTFESASVTSTDDLEALRLMQSSAKNFERAEMHDNAAEIVNKMRAHAKEKGCGELILLRSFEQLSIFQKKDEINLAIQECVVEMDPSDISARFSLAYKHSSCQNDDLALLHYLNIPHQNRNSMAWNNLGVEFDHFLLPAKSVGAYRRAKEMGETLAMSNLALKFMSVGFLSEALEQCQEAMGVADFHKNVNLTNASLSDIPDKEDERQNEILDKAQPKSDFFKHLGRATLQPEPSKISERWVGPDCDLRTALIDGIFVASGTYLRPRGLGLIRSSFGSVGEPSSEESSLRFRVEYKGTLYGRAIEAQVTRVREKEKPIESALLDSSKGSENAALMVLTDDEAGIMVMENSPGNDPRFYTLVRSTT